MKGENRALLLLVSAGMELTYLYACTIFVTTGLFHQTFPFAEAVGSFLAAALLTLFTDGRGWRVIFVLGFQSLVFIPALFRMVEIFNSWSASFASLPLFTESSISPVDATGYFTFMLVIAWIWVFWAGGAQLARRPMDYTTVCSRFDRGLGAFFALLLVKFYLQVGQGVRVDESVSGFLLFPFLIFGLLAIGLVRNQGSAQRDFLPGYQRLGVVLGFIVVVLLLGTALVFFCLPFLTFAAEGGYGILNFLSAPVISLLLQALHWLFPTDYGAADEQPTTQAPHPTSQWNAPWWLELIAQIVAVVVVIIVVLFVLAFIGMMLYFIFQGLMGKTEVDPGKKGVRGVLASFMLQLRAWLVLLWRRLLRHAPASSGGILLYTALRTWGRHSGLPHFLSETPIEYGRRLKTRFPAFQREIECIVQAFNREVYGEVALDQQQLAPARSAWRQLASPLHWPMRVKAWFVRSPRASPVVPVRVTDQI